MGDILKVYFKDLRVAVQRKIKKFFIEHDIDVYHDEKDIPRSIEELYNNTMPFYGFVWIPDEEEDRTAMNDMVS